MQRWVCRPNSRATRHRRPPWLLPSTTDRLVAVLRSSEASVGVGGVGLRLRCLHGRAAPSLKGVATPRDRPRWAAADGVGLRPGGSVRRVAAPSVGHGWGRANAAAPRRGYATRGRPAETTAIKDDKKKGQDNEKNKKKKVEQEEEQATAEKREAKKKTKKTTTKEEPQEYALEMTEESQVKKIGQTATKKKGKRKAQEQQQEENVEMQQPSMTNTQTAKETTTTAATARSAESAANSNKNVTQMTLGQLKEECRRLGVPVTGSKTQLLQRLQERIDTPAVQPQAGPKIRIILAEKKSAAETIAKALGIKPVKKEGAREPGFIGNVELTPTGLKVISGESETDESATVVTWASGHLFELQKHTSWKLSNLPILPSEWTFTCKGPAQKKQFEVIRRLFQSADEIVNACDAGREGELIFREIFQQSEARAPFKRLWISSLTDDAIRQGFQKLQEGEKYDPLFKSALTRTKADWLIGMNATQAYTLNYRPKVPSFQGKECVSLGRVQTPVLKMVVDRWKAVSSFKPEPYWELFLQCQPQGLNDQLRLKWFLPDPEKPHLVLSEHFSSEQEAEDIRYMLSAECTVEKINRKNKLEKPPRLFDLTALQREANQRFGYTAERTLIALQGLYENHKLISYPRTDSRYLTPDLMPEIKTTLNGLGQQSIYTMVIKDIQENNKVTLSNKDVFNPDKVSDHHAIIPTTKLPSEKMIEHLSRDERKIYHLIVSRLLSCFMSDCQKQQTELIAVNQANYFRAKGTSLVKPGWRSAYSISPFATVEDKEEAIEEVSSESGGYVEGTEAKGGADVESAASIGNLTEIVNSLTEKATLQCQLPADIIRRETTPPALLTDSSLLHLMETAGRYMSKKALHDIDREANEIVEDSLKDFALGTPATRAQTIERLINVKYIKREGRKLVPTEKGKILIDLLQKISSSLTSPQLTGQWEKRLQDIAKGEGSSDSFLEDIKQYTAKIVDEAKEGATKLPDFKKLMWTIDPERDDKQQKQQSSHETSSSPQQEEEKEEELGCSCWKCGKGRMVTRGLWKMWRCSNAPCDFVLWKSSCGREMHKEELIELATEGVTPLLSGFKSKAGKPFEARLAINQDNKMVFMFPFTKWRRGQGAGRQYGGSYARRSSSAPSEVDE